VHLLPEELFAELRAGGFDLTPGAIGENVTTRGIDLIALPTGARLRLAPTRWSRSPACAIPAASSMPFNPD